MKVEARIPRPDLDLKPLQVEEVVSGRAERVVPNDDLVAAHAEVVPRNSSDLSILENWHYAVQIASMTDGAMVEEYIAHLSRKGYRPIIWESVDEEGRRFNRILLGVYETISQARQAQENYGRQEKKPAFILPESQLITEETVAGDPVPQPAAVEEDQFALSDEFDITDDEVRKIASIDIPFVGMEMDEEKDAAQADAPRKTESAKRTPIKQKDPYFQKPWSYAVQVAAVYEQAVADRVTAYLVKTGFPPLIWESLDKNGRKFKRIWIGVFQDIKRAKEVMEQYRLQENRPAFIVPKRSVKGENDPG